MPVFGHVEALELGLRVDPQHTQPLQDVEQHEAESERPEAGHRDADELDAEELEAAAVEEADHRVAVPERLRCGEEADREGAPHAVHAVDRDGADRVVHVDLVEEEHAEDDEYAADGADEQGRVRRHEVAGRGDRDEARERAVQGHREIGLAHDDPGGDERGAGSGAGGEVRGHRDAADRADAGGVARGVEAEPADPEEEDAERAEDEAVARDRVRLAVMTVLADARAEHHRAREGQPAADRVDDRRTGEVVEAQGLDPTDGFRTVQTAPHPVARHRVDERGDERRVDQVAAELDALRHRARDDRRGRRGEHGLEEEERPVPGSLAREDARHAEAAPAERAAQLRGAEHERRADEVEHDRAEREVHQVLHHDVRRVLRPREARLDERKARLHDEHEDAAEERPHDVQVRLDVRRRRRRVRREHAVGT